MKKKITIIIERGTDGTYSAYMDDSDLSFGLIGDGKTVKETIDDLMNSAAEMKAYYEETGREFPDLAYTFKYDIPSFLQHYAFAFTLAGLERITGVRQGQLSHYINGVRKPSPKTAQKIEARLHEFAKEIGQVNFV